VRALEVAGRPILLCNAEGKLYALDDECPHAGIPMAEGRLRGCILECPLHGGKLDVRDGRPAALPIRTPARCYAVRSGAAGVEIEIPD
jgi:nitrite reductase/ring-hydroxylating ferredoxin subunit